MKQALPPRASPTVMARRLKVAAKRARRPWQVHAVLVSVIVKAKDVHHFLCEPTSDQIPAPYRTPGSLPKIQPIIHPAKAKRMIMAKIAVFVREPNTSFEGNNDTQNCQTSQM
jgi:hypothetical protein